MRPAGRSCVVPEIEDLRGDDHAVQILHGFHFNGPGADAVKAGGGGGKGHVFRDLDPLADAVVVGDDEVARAADAELADDGGMGALKDAQDLAMGAAVGLDAADVDHHAIAMHGAAGVLLGNVNVAAEAGDGNVGSDEGETVAMDVEASGGELAAGTRRDIMTGSGFHDLAARGQAIELGFDIGAGCALTRKLAQQLFESGPAVREFADVR